MRMELLEDVEPDDTLDSGDKGLVMTTKPGVES